MKALYQYHDAGDVVIEQFLQSFPAKQQERLLRQIAMLLFPQLGKPPLKHFQMDRYRSLFELRDKYKTTLTRIIFTYDAGGNVILLEAFIKNHKRKTDAALASALAKMRRIELDPAHFLLEVDITDYFKKIT